MTAPIRSHENCGPDCFWCALQAALRARQGAVKVEMPDGGETQGCTITPKELARDIDQICNFLGDIIASEPSDEGFADLCTAASVMLSNRVMESRARNMTHPVWRAQHERANGEGGTA